MTFAPAKQCKYGCGKSVHWSYGEECYFEVDTGEKHDRKRCEQIKQIVGKYVIETDLGRRRSGVKPK
jgi:hypothetical protein